MRCYCGIKTEKHLGLRGKKTNKDVLGMCMITTGQFLGVFIYVSNDAEAEKAWVHFKFIYLPWVIFFHFIAVLTLFFFIKRNYCSHRCVDSVRSTTGFWCWYPVFIKNKDRACYIKRCFLSLFPAFLSRRKFSSLSILPLWNDLYFRMNSTHRLSKNHFGWLWFIHINWILQRFFSLWPASQNPCRKLYHTKKKQSDQSE